MVERVGGWESEKEMIANRAGGGRERELSWLRNGRDEDGERRSKRMRRRGDSERTQRAECVRRHEERGGEGGGMIQTDGLQSRGATSSGATSSDSSWIRSFSRSEGRVRFSPEGEIHGGSAYAMRGALWIMLSRPFDLGLI